MRIDSSVLITALREAGYEPRAYSGRGMGGAECVAVDPDDMSGGIFGLGARLAMIDPAYADLRPREDSMGNGGIVYFPGAKWPAKVST